MRTPDERPVIQIDITNACTHRCSNCTRFCGFQKKPFFMDYDYFCKAVDTLKDRKGVIGIIGGEPTLHPRFREMCEYVDRKLPRNVRVDKTELKYPTNDYMGLLNRVKLGGFELLEYGGMTAMGVTGTGLWTSITPQYRKNLETILDVFDEQFVNDHTSISYHQPILVSRKEMGIGDEEWLRLREDCWVNKFWSGSVTPKGCFFCEVAASLDLLYDGPGGLPLEDGWWKRPIEDYEEQFRWCEICGIPLQTYSRNANEGIMDASREHIGRMKTTSQVDFEKVKSRINELKISDGKVINSEDEGAYRGSAYLDDSNDRVAKDSAANAGTFVGVLVLESGEDPENGMLRRLIEENSSYLEELLIIENGKINRSYKGGSFQAYDDIPATINNLIKQVKGDKYIVLFDNNIRLLSRFKTLSKCVINPGILFYANLKTNGMDTASKSTDAFVTVHDKEKHGKCLLFSSFANAWEDIDKNKIIDGRIFSFLSASWIQEKKLPLSNKINRYIIKGGKRDISIRRIKNMCYFLRKYADRHGLRGTASLITYKIKGKSGKGLVEMAKMAWKRRF